MAVHDPATCPSCLDPLAPRTETVPEFWLRLALGVRGRRWVVEVAGRPWPRGCQPWRQTLIVLGVVTPAAFCVCAGGALLATGLGVLEALGAAVLGLYVAGTVASWCGASMAWLGLLRWVMRRARE